MFTVIQLDDLINRFWKYGPYNVKNKEMSLPLYTFESFVRKIKGSIVVQNNQSDVARPEKWKAQSLFCKTTKL